MLIRIIIHIAAIVCGFAVFLFFRRMPTSWLLDYGENKVNAELYRKQQIPFTPFAVSLMAAGLVLSWILLNQYDSFFYPAAVFLICMILFLIIIADFQTRIIPDQFVVALIPLALMLWFFSDRKISDLLMRIAAGLLSGLLLAAIGWAGSKLMHQEAMGMGDVKLLAAAGLLTGLQGIAMVFVLSFVIALIPAIIMLIMRRINPEKDGSLAFGPFISISVIIVLLFKDNIYQLWNWWLNLIII